MLPPRPQGNQRVDLEQAGQTISNAQHNRHTSFVPIVDEFGKVIMVRSDDPRATGANRVPQEMIDKPVY